MYSGRLTKRYLQLKAAGDAADSAELDRIYRQIIELPVSGVADALDKLQFARHCLTEEADFTEAQTLIGQVADGLESLARQETLRPRRGP
jgi:hypothetical protein